MVFLVRAQSDDYCLFVELWVLNSMTLRVHFLIEYISAIISLIYINEICLFFS